MSESHIEPLAKRLRNTSATDNPTSDHTDEPLTKKPKSSSEQHLPSMYELSDECLEKLFERFNVELLCRMANVCKRFRQIADKVFADKHTEFVLKGKCSNSMFRRVLVKFGHMITSIDDSEAYFTVPIDTDAIAKYCPNKLEKLSLTRATIDCAAFQPLFVRMKELALDGCDFIGNKQNLFSVCSNLEYLYFDSDENSCAFVAQKYPKLSRLAFDPNFSSFGTFIQLLRLNPQIENLQIMAMAQDIYITSVLQSTKNLECLTIMPGMMSSTLEIQTKKVFLQLAKLKKLKKLTLAAGYETYAKLVAPLTDAFAKGAVGLDELILRDFEIGSKEIKNIANLKTLKVLSLDTIGKKVSNADLLSLSKLPLLTDLALHFGYESPTPVTLDEIMKMIEEAKRMTNLALVGIRNLKIDGKGYEKLLKVVQSRSDGSKVTIQIIGCSTTTSFDVPQNVQQMNINQLKIVYETDDEDQCDCKTCG